VICAANGQEAVSILARAEDTFDIVFMDLQMPIMDGFEATRQIRKQWQKGDLPIISLTAHILSGERGLCKKVGMNGHLTKPIDIEELHRCLLRWIKPGNRSGNLPVVNERRQSPYGELPDMLPGLDVASGLGRLHGNTELYRRLVISFSRDRSGIAEEIRQALANGDLKQCKDLAHALVGVAGHIAATGLHAVACDLEAACTRGESELLGQLLTDLEVRLAEVLFTAKFLNEQIPPVTVAPVSGKIDPRAVVSLLKELGELSAQQNLKVWRKVSLLGNLLAGSEYAPFATRLSDTLEILDFAAASRQIEALSLLLGAQFPEIRPD
jgi:CheY-like chemotaxis protein